MFGHKTKTQGGINHYKKNKHDIGGQVDETSDDKSNYDDSSDSESEENCSHHRNVCCRPQVMTHW